MKVYAVKVGGRLWITGGLAGFGFNQKTTENLLYAKWFENEAQALSVAKKSRGEVVEINITERNNEEIDMMRASITQLQKERDAALNELNLYKMNHLETDITKL
ncbi:MAG: hypothetical protein IJI66_14005 [Erysipelotrichaceae bacterium]|nr:hypothetical protein [Erysipelotrichaceae bacterium]